MAALHLHENAPAPETNMKRTAWLRKTLWITLVVLFLLAGGGLIALRTYLSSAAAVRQVAERLQEVLGGRIEIQSAQIGLFGSSRVRGIEVYEDGEFNKPWLRIDEATADVSVLSLLCSKSPQDVHLQGARILLRFDSGSRLRTKLPTHKNKKTAPERLPSLHIDGGELTFEQQHRSPMIIRGVHADLVSAASGLKLTGTVNDPFWGDWKANGDFNNTGSQGSITLAAESVAVTMTKLKSVPFVPPLVWQEVQLEGMTPAQVRLDMETKGDKTSVHYRVEIAPQAAHVQVLSIDLDATQANGRVIVADEVVELDNVHGKTAGGSITASGKLNFHDEPTRLIFKAGVQDVVLHELPQSWNIPSNIDGKLTGSADLVVTIQQGKIETAGSGEGVIREANWDGFPIDKPVRLTLHSEKGRFRFHQPEPIRPAVGKKIEAQVRLNYPAGARDEEQRTRSTRDSKTSVVNASGPSPFALDEIVDLLGHGIKLAADGLSKGIDAAAKTLGKLKPPSRPGEGPTYLDVDLHLQNVDLTQLVQKLKLNLPYAVTGRLTFQVHASIPINTAADLKAYRLRGHAKLTTFNVAGLTMTHVEAKVRYTNGVLDLEKLSGQAPGRNEKGVERGNERLGKFEGNARVEVVPRGDLQAALKLDEVPLGMLLDFVSPLKGQMAGMLSGTVQVRAPLMKLSDPASWRGSANLHVPSVEIFGLPLRNAAVRLIVDAMRARLSTFQADIEGAPLTGQAELQLQGAYPFQAEAHLSGGDLTMLHRLAPAFRPPFELKGRTQFDGAAKGTLKPLQFDANGRLHAHNLVVERFAVDDLSFRWSKDKNDLKIDDIKMQLYGGSVIGSAWLPLSATAPGGADLGIRNLDVQAMAKALPALPLRLEGKVSGTVKGQLSASEGKQPRTWTSNVEVTAPQLRVQGVPAERLKGVIDSRAGKTTYNFQGETLGGVFTIKGDLPVPAKGEEKKPAEELPLGKQAQSIRTGPERPGRMLRAGAFAAEGPVGSGRFELRNAQLARLWPIYDITGPLSRLNGRFSIFLDYGHIGPGLTPSGTGSFQIVNIGWDDAFLGSSLQGNVRLTADAFEVYNVSGDMTGGLFLGRFAFGLKPNSRSWFWIELQQAEASRLLVPLSAAASRVKGPVDVTLRGNIGRDWDGSGGVTLARGQVYGIEITEWRIPLTFSFSPSQGSGELTVRDSQARLAQGRARMEGTLNWGNGLRLAGLLLFYDVNLSTLLRSVPELSSYASGRVSGRVDLAGNEVRSLNDLTALVQVKMKQGQALQMPVLRYITPYLRAGAATTTFQSGELKGRLASGVFRIEHATLVGEFIKLLILGTSDLAGNLNLEVTAQTGLFCLNPTRTAALSQRIPLVGAIPRLLLYEANTLLAAAVVHLRITGPMRAPVVRLEPLVTLTEEAVRFFLGRAISLAIPNVP
jgi:translocation and assembly module TamB